MGLLDMYTLGWSLIDGQVLLYMLIGVLAGIIIGMLPGLGPTLGLVVVLPFTFKINVTCSLALMLSILTGGCFGGSIASILCNIPGTTVAVVTTFDGYPLAQKGYAGKAIGISCIASCCGGIISAVILSVAAPAIARWALNFAAPEFFSIAILGISVIAYISQGNMVKGLISGLFGMLIGCIGLDPITAVGRFTFKNFNLLSGVSYFAVLIGLFGAAETLRAAEKQGKGVLGRTIQNVGKMVPSFKEFMTILPSIIRSSAIGTFIGAIPAAGGSIATIVAYGVEKRIAKDGDTFGQGNIKGLATPESANNACNGGAMIPMLTLGIPGDPATAILMGAFLVNGLTLGPTLFTQRPADVSSIFIILILSTLLFTVIGLTCSQYISKILDMPMPVLMPIVGLLCCIGVFAIRNNTFDFIILLICCLLGYFLPKAGFSPAPIVLGVVLGPIIETNFRRALIIFDGNAMGFFTRPVSCVFIILTIVMLVAPALMEKFKKNKVVK